MKLGTIRKTPLGALLYVTFVDSGLKLPEFISAIGYSNIPKGIRTFQAFVNTGTGNPIFLERLQASRLAIDDEAFLDALRLTDQQLQAEEEKERALIERERELSFRPACYAVPRLDPGAQITIYAVTRDFEKETIQLPTGIGSWPPEAQYRYVQRKIRAHYQQTGGRVPLLGAIVSYLYYRSWNEPPLALTIDGQPLGVAPEGALPQISLRLRNRPVPCELLASFLRKGVKKAASTEDHNANQNSHKD